jgi:alkylation response protein AidB-like acyl-CoA dehydrogenase
MAYVWKGASVTRLMPTEESVDLLSLVEDFAAAELAPRAAADEASSTFPRDALRSLGELGVLGLPFDAQYGGAEQPYEVTLQVLEEVARA